VTVGIVLSIGAVALLASALHATIGFGSGPLLVPALLLVVAPRTATVAAVLCGMAVNLLQLRAERRTPRLPLGTLAPVWLAAPPGALAGALLAGGIGREMLAVVVAAALLACGAAALLKPTALPAPALAAGGAVAGFSAALTGVFGPLLGALLLAAGCRGAGLRDAIGTSFLVVGLCAVAATLALAPAWDGLALAAALLTPAVAGHALGDRLFARLSPRAHRRAVVTAVLAGACAALAPALA
jgi:uncharacterized membrane protein YfcA